MNFKDLAVRISGIIIVLVGLVLLLGSSLVVKAQEAVMVAPEYGRYEFYGAYGVGGYMEARDEAWQAYINDKGEEESTGGNGYAGQTGVVDTAGFLAIYNNGYEYYAHYNLSEYDLSNYSQSELLTVLTDLIFGDLHHGMEQNIYGYHSTL